MDYKLLAKKARLKVLEMVHRGQTSHIASNFSCIDFATVLYENIKDCDEVVWSAGWKSATIYYFLAKQGKIPESDLLKFPNEPYIGLAETTVPGVLVNGGSVGHGLPIAVGMALAKKRSGESGTIYCICSDGEMNEGTVWESAMLSSHHKLDNLVVIVDKNGFQAMGKTEEVVDVNVARAFSGFGWSYVEIDGHNYGQVEKSLSPFKMGQPYVIVCNTVKGKGVKEMENHLTYHYKHVDDDLYRRAIEEITYA